MTLSAPVSEVDVCKLAAILLKQKLPVSIDPIDENSSTIEVLCAEEYQHVRRLTLRMHPWNFGTTRIALPKNAVAPAFGFSHAYDLPNDFIRYLSRHDSIGTRITTRSVLEEYQIENNQILMNSADDDAINIRYIYDHTTIAQWDPLAIDLFAVNLALRLAPNFTGSENRIQSLKEERRLIRADATAIDGQERPPIRIQRSRFLDARRQLPRVAGKFTDFT